MPNSRLQLLSIGLVLLLGGGAQAATPSEPDGSLLRLPPIDGQLSGVFHLSAWPAAPRLHWQVTSRSAGSRRFAHVALDGDGTRLRVAADVDAQGNGSWKLTDARFNAGSWFPTFAARIGAAFSNATATGVVELSGGGQVAGGRPSGTLHLQWRDGEIRDATAGWALTGVSLQGEFSLDTARGTLVSVTPLEFGIATITTSRFGARNLRVRGVLREGFSVSLQEARVEIAGGDITIDPCTIPLVPFSISTRIRVNSVGLQDVAALVPASLAETRGRVSGAVGFSWSEADGIELGAGALQLDPAEPAMVRLAAAPGFLTRRVPRRVAVLPGFAANWFKPRNPAYEEVEAIELGQTMLEIQRLTIQLSPEGDAAGRTASVRIEARPKKEGSIVRRVSFDVNVAGPLSAVLRMGMNRGFSLQLQ